jgi:hypothetical protein
MQSIENRVKNAFFFQNCSNIDRLTSELRAGDRPGFIEKCEYCPGRLGNLLTRQEMLESKYNISATEFSWNRYKFGYILLLFFANQRTTWACDLYSKARTCQVHKVIIFYRLDLGKQMRNKEL